MKITTYEIKQKGERVWAEVAKKRLSNLSISELNDLIIFIDILIKKFELTPNSQINTNEKLTKDFAGNTVWVSILDFKNELNKKKLDKIKDLLFSIEETKWVDTGWSLRFMDWLDDKFLFSLKDYILLNEIKSIIENKRLLGKLKEIPTNIEWKDIKICFQSRTRINLYAKDSLIGEYSFFDFGMGKRKPNRLWEFLLLLSAFNTFDDKVVAKPDQKTLTKYGKEKVNNLEKKVSDLSQRLKELFGISENPFYSHSVFSEYRTKFKLEPSPELRRKKERLKTVELDENKDYGEYLN